MNDNVIIIRKDKTNMEILYELKTILSYWAIKQKRKYLQNELEYNFKEIAPNGCNELHIVHYEDNYIIKTNYLQLDTGKLVLDFYLLGRGLDNNPYGKSRCRLELFGIDIYPDSIFTEKKLRKDIYELIIKKYTK